MPKTQEFSLKVMLQIQQVSLKKKSCSKHSFHLKKSWPKFKWKILSQVLFRHWVKYFFVIGSWEGKHTNFLFNWPKDHAGTDHPLWASFSNSLTLRQSRAAKVGYWPSLPLSIFCFSCFTLAVAPDLRYTPTVNIPWVSMATISLSTITGILCSSDTKLANGTP